MRNIEAAGGCAGTLAGAAVGAKVATSICWFLGPLYPAAVAGGTIVGGFLGYITGTNVGEVIDDLIDGK